MNNKKSLRSVFCILFLIAVCTIGIFSFSGCGGADTCTEHDFDEWPVTPICEEEGLIARSCKKCGYYEEVESPALGHDFADWEISQEASCRHTGVERRRCKVCEKDETRDIPKLTHTVEEWAINTEPTTEAVGRASGRCTVDACGEYVYVDLPVINETNYTIETVDSETKNYTLKTGEYKFDFIISKYLFFEKK